MNALGVVGGVLVVVGGVYVLKKTGLLDKAVIKLETVGACIKDSFLEGYNEAAQAAKAG